MSREALGERDQDLIFWSQQLVIVILDAGRPSCSCPSRSTFRPDDWLGVLENEQTYR
jgi:hypothetical protein